VFEYIAINITSAPTKSLRDALQRHSLGPLNPFPFVIQMGANFGWIVYGYSTHNLFVVAANTPGLFCSLWMNFGAMKIEYFDYVLLPDCNKIRQKNVSWFSQATMTDQERMLFTLLGSWTAVLALAALFSSILGNSATVIGIAVNLNYVLYFGAPLEKMLQVIQTEDASSIHIPTMILSFFNASFWVLYGYRCKDLVLVIPSAAGAVLCLMQAALILRYGPHNATTEELKPIFNEDSECASAGEESVLSSASQKEKSSEL
jgi:uncharacterized protein with PQ loop repeat